MAKAAKKKRGQALAKSAPKNTKAKDNVKVESPSGNFDVELGLIHAARARAVAAVNTTLIELYWSIGQYISRKAAKDGWGTGTVAELSRAIQRKYPGMTGYSASNLWRMTQFYEMYCEQPKLAPLVRVLSWTHNLLIMGGCKPPEAREFYVRIAAQERWGKRELERQIAGALFERTVLAPPKLAPVVRVLHPAADTVFKDTYMLDFLDLPPVHSEADLQHALVANLKRFLIELGRDFAFVGEQYLLQVGGTDFRLDLLFYHRSLQCLVAFDLKINHFEPEHLGKMEFYLEALDRDVKKPHERPSIGVLLCATKDDEVVEYALSRSLSPALIAEYQTALPDRRLLQRKLHELYQLSLPADGVPPSQSRPARKARKA